MRKRHYGLMLLAVLTAAPIATGGVTRPVTLRGAAQAEQAIAGSAGDKAGGGRESS